MADNDFNTEISNIGHRTDDISEGVTAALVQKIVVVPLIRKENLPVGTPVKLWRKGGSLEAEGLAESTAYTFSAKSEYTETTVSSTATKTVCCAKYTVESEQFVGLDEAKLAREAGSAIARELDTNVTDLFDNFVNSVTATTVLTSDDVMQAAYVIDSGLAAPEGENCKGVFDPKGIHELRKELIKSSAAPLSNPSLITLLTGLPDGNGYCGSLPGVDLYKMTGLPTSGADDCACVFNGAIAFGGVYGPSVNVRPMWRGSQGFYTEVDCWLFSDVVEVVDAAGCTVKSDT